MEHLINMELIVEAITERLIETEGFDFYSTDAAELRNEYESMIRGNMQMDNKSKVELLNAHCLAIEEMVVEAFKNGMKIGMEMRTIFDTK